MYLFSIIINCYYLPLINNFNYTLAPTVYNDPHTNASALGFVMKHVFIDHTLLSIILNWFAARSSFFSLQFVHMYSTHAIMYYRWHIFLSQSLLTYDLCAWNTIAAGAQNSVSEWIHLSLTAPLMIQQWLSMKPFLVAYKYGIQHNKHVNTITYHHATLLVISTIQCTCLSIHIKLLHWRLLKLAMCITCTYSVLCNFAMCYPIV